MTKKHKILIDTPNMFDRNSLLRHLEKMRELEANGEDMTSEIELDLQKLKLLDALSW